MVEKFNETNYFGDYHYYCFVSLLTGCYEYPFDIENSTASENSVVDAGNENIISV